MCTCAANQFWNEQTQECQTCPTGSFSPGGAATSTSCTSCARDEFWNEQTQECQTCPTNEFSEGGAATTTTCMTCPAGQYRNNDAGCGACPTGSTSPGGSGSVTSCDTCLSHYYKSGSTCVACPMNSVGAGGSATSCTCLADYHAHWSGSAWSCLACDAPYVKSGSVVPQSTESSDTCDDPPPCQRELKVERVGGDPNWGAPFYFTCGEGTPNPVEVYAGISSSRTKLVIPPNNIAWGSCPTASFKRSAPGTSGFRYPDTTLNYDDVFKVTETNNCGCRRTVRITRTDSGASDWGHHMSVRCANTGGANPVEVIVGNSGSKTKDVVLFSPYNGECPSTFTLGTDNFRLDLLSTTCHSGNRVYDGASFEQWIHSPAADQVVDVQSSAPSPNFGGGFG